jgi:hypothetical protein
MSPEDILKKLREANIPADGSWRENKGKRAKIPLLEKQKELLGKLEEVLVMQVEKDKVLLTDLQEKLTRLKHGGGR